MVFPLFLKLLFGIWVWLVIIPRFSAKRKFRNLLLEAMLSIVVFMLAEWVVKNNTSHSLHHSHNFFDSLWFQFIIYSLILSLCLALFFTREWIRNERLKRQMIETQLTTELNFLKSQINPHFLFNTLNNLFSIAQKTGNTQLESGIYKLSGLMRYVIYETGLNKVPLEKEIEYINDFIGLSRLRFTEEELRVSMLMEGPVKEALIAPMILIPFVENAFKHGIKIESHSFINILIQVDGDKIIFECINSLHHLKGTDDAHTGIGLNNVKRRLALLYPDKHQLEVIRSEDSYKVNLVLTI